MRTFLFIFFASIFSNYALSYISVHGHDLSHSKYFFLIDDVGDKVNQSFKINYHQVSSPLTYKDASEQERDVISNIQSLYLSTSYKFSEKFYITAELGSHIVKSSTFERENGLSDLRLKVVHTIGSAYNLNFGLSAFVDIPTGSEELYLSSGTAAGGFDFFVSSHFNNFHFIASMGALYSPDANYMNINYKKQIRGALGIAYSFNEFFSTSLEAQSSYLIDDVDSEVGPGDIMLGFKYGDSSGPSWEVGVGTGQLESHGTHSYRAVAGVSIPYGSIGSTSNKCYSKPFSISFNARPLVASEMPEENELPYISSADRRVPMLTIGESSGVKDGVPFVKDSQSVFAIDLIHLPKLKNIKTIDSVRLRLPLSKVNEEKHPIETELICEYKEKICMGKRIYSDKWKENINKDFFEHAISNENYFEESSLFNKSQLGFNKELNINLIEALAITEIQLMNLLFSNDKKSKTLYFVAADDVYVGSNVYLDIVLKEEICD